MLDLSREEAVRIIELDLSREEEVRIIRLDLSREEKRVKRSWSCLDSDEEKGR